MKFSAAPLALALVLLLRREEE